MADDTTNLELRINGKQFSVKCLAAETRLDKRRRAFTVYKLQLIQSGARNSTKPLTKPFFRRYHQFKQLSQHLLSYNFDHPPVPHSGGFFNTSTTEHLVKLRMKSLIVWINSLLDTIEIGAVRGRQKAESRLGLNPKDIISPKTSPRMSRGSPALKTLTRPVRKAARAIMAFLHPRPGVDPGGSISDLSNMPPTPVGSITSLYDMQQQQQSGNSKKQNRHDRNFYKRQQSQSSSQQLETLSPHLATTSALAPTPDLARVQSLMSSWSPGSRSTSSLNLSPERKTRREDFNSTTTTPSTTTLFTTTTPLPSLPPPLPTISELIHTRPIPENPSSPTIITTTLFIHSISNIAPDGDSIYSVDLHIDMTWSEHRLPSETLNQMKQYNDNDDSNEINLSNLNDDNSDNDDNDTNNENEHENEHENDNDNGNDTQPSCWTPCVEISNSDSYETVTSKMYYTKSTQSITLSQRLRVECRSDTIDLHEFPFDHQSLPLRMESSTHTSNEVTFQIITPPKLASVVKDPLHGNAEWRVDHTSACVKLNLLEFDNTTYSSLVLMIHVQRKAGYYMKKIVIVMWLIQIIAWSTFAMNPMSVGTRIAVTAEAGLCVVSFNMVIAESLPNLPYLSRLDYFTSIIFWSVALTVSEHVISFTLASRSLEGSSSSSSSIESIEDGMMYALLLDWYALLLSVFVSTGALLRMVLEWRKTWKQYN